MTPGKTPAAFYEQLTGQAPEGLWFAPGRVNLIGEHTDYNDGFVLPFALRQRAVVAAGRRDDGMLVMHSIEVGETVTRALSDLEPYGEWSAYLAGVVWALRQSGHPMGGATLVLTSDVPLGAGLSSSAAIECAVVTAMAEMYGLDIEPMDRARVAQMAENDFVGAPTGILDQAASILCEADAGLFLDCRSLEATTVPLSLHEAGLEILVLDTRTPHSHVDGEYGARRATCEQAASLLGVPALRDVEDLDAALSVLEDAVMRRRVTHVVTENERVLRALDLACEGRLEELGPLLDASHASMRDDYEITVPTVDLAVATAKQHGALGARMTGGGFGGCIIALCHKGQGMGIGQRVAEAFTEPGYTAPAWFIAQPSQGAARLG